MAARCAQLQYRQDRFWWIGPFTLHAVVSTPLKLFAPSVGSQPVQAVASLGFILLCYFGALHLWRTSARGRLYVLLAAGPLLGAAAAWAAGSHIYAERNLIGVGPFAALLASAAAVPSAAASRVRWPKSRPPQPHSPPGSFSFGTAATAAPF